MNDLLLRDPAEVFGAYYKAQCMQTLMGNNPINGLADKVTADGGNVLQRDYFFPTTATPRAVAVTTPEKTFWFIGGIELMSQGNAIWNAYLGANLNPFTEQPQNQWFIDAAQLIWSSAPAIHRIRTPVYIGYSAGGAVAYHSRRKWYEAVSIGGSANCTMFGAPKAQARDTAPIGDPHTAVNWISVDDPVPNVPPQLRQWERFVAGYSTFQITRLNNYFLYQKVRTLGVDGTITVDRGAYLGNTANTTAIGAWLEQVTNGVQNAHSIASYVARLLLATLLYTPANEPDTNGGGTAGGQDDNPPVSPGISRRAIAVSTQAIFQDATRQNLQQVVIPPAQQFTYRRNGRVYYVLFGGTEIAIAPKKKRAKALARIGNAWLQKLQNEAVVNPDAIVAQFEQYVAAATDPAGGFVPRLNTNP